MSNIILKRKYSWNNEEYVCELTDFINEKFDLPLGQRFGFYINDTRDIWDNKTLAIRIPGRTVGCIRIDDNGIILNCKFYDDENNINEKLKRFIGSKIIFKQESN